MKTIKVIEKAEELIDLLIQKEVKLKVFTANNRKLYMSLLEEDKYQLGNVPVAVFLDKILEKAGISITDVEFIV